MAATVELVIVDGPYQGARVTLKPTEKLRIGRGGKGLQIHDHLVSMQHAEVGLIGDRYWIEDLQSVTGTFVNDERITEPTPLGEGSRIKLGDSVIEVHVRQQSRALAYLGAAAAFAGGVGIVTYGVYQVIQGVEIEYDPHILWHEPVRQGATESVRIDTPTRFIRETGIDHRDLKIREVEDYNGDGVDEVWLAWPKGERIITFDESGSWQTVADLPVGCETRGTALTSGIPAQCLVDPSTVKGALPPECASWRSASSMPELRCPSGSFTFVEGKYVPADQEGIVTWMPAITRTPGDSETDPPKLAIAPPGTPPEPWRFSFLYPERLAGFLAERGVNEPIHYLLCEGTLEGVPAQVLTEAGEIKPLTTGCAKQFQLLGATRTAEFFTLQPLAFALTATGYQALLDDVSVFYAGSTDKIFMPPDKGRFLAAMSTPPTARLGVMTLTFEGPELPVSAVAQEGSLPPGPRQIQVRPFALAPPPLATTETIFETADGAFVVDPPGCSELRVSTGTWHCAKRHGCAEMSEFIRVKNEGCKGKLGSAALTYKAGVAKFKDDFIDVRVVVEAKNNAGQIDVLRARVSYREPPKAPEAPKAED
jgi:hypothetical protein